MRVDPDAEQRWSTYLLSLLGFSLASVLVLFGLGRLQDKLPLDIGMAPLDPAGAWNTAVSFVTNTNWQWYSGEAAAGHLFQMAGLAVQNFVSAAVGISVVAALARGFARSGTDAPRRQLLGGPRAGDRPGAAAARVRRGARAGRRRRHPEPERAHRDRRRWPAARSRCSAGRSPPRRPSRSSGTNGGGFFNANSAHPFENPTPWTNALEVVLLLLIPFSLPRTFGRMVGDRRQGWAILAAMSTLWIAAVGLLTWAEMAGPGLVPAAAGGAMEGKEVRFGEAASALFAASTTMTSTGAVNSMHDSLTAQGGGVALVGMLLGEVSPGGVGSGLYGMVVLIIVAVFLAGLMVGRTPEYLGKKIGRQEITLVALYVLTMPAVVLIGSAIAISTPAGPGRAAAGRSARALGDRLRLRVRREQQRLRVRGPDRRARRSTTRCWAWRCWSAGSCRSRSCWRWPAGSPASGRCPRAPARCRPTRRCSSASW